MRYDTALNLVLPSWWHTVSAEDKHKACNGVGPDYFPAWLRLQALKDAAARDTATETVPEELDMTLDEWRMLKAAYIECPECLSLTDAERAALQAATGK